MINAWWFTEVKNFGDMLNPYLIEKMSGQKVKFINNKDIPKYLCVGSIIHVADDNSTVWGPGFILDEHQLQHRPKILAVRGPKTREKLLKSGHDCPEIYGDPALLLPRYFNPPITKTHKIGIIPHYCDKNHEWVRKQNHPEIKIIDVQGEVEDVIKEILSCEKIISSSLHGVIVADAYGIPGYWIKFQEGLGNFKFEDYLMSVGRSTKPIIIKKETSLEQIIDQLEDYKIDIDLDKLYESCPFKMSKIDLSILVCTIPSRTRFLVRLLYNLEKQSKNKSVEILYLGDNKEMTVGEKRNKLLGMASGKYVVFIDDDDRISDDYVDSILNKINENSDVITFNVEISENGSEYKKVLYDINFNCDRNLQNSYERLPNHLMVVKKDLAIKAKFPEKSFGEDGEYAKRLKPLLKSQSKINKTLYYYDFDENTTETRG